MYLLATGFFTWKTTHHFRVGLRKAHLASTFHNPPGVLGWLANYKAKHFIGLITAEPLVVLLARFNGQELRGNKSRAFVRPDVEARHLRMVEWNIVLCEFSNPFHAFLPAFGILASVHYPIEDDHACHPAWTGKSLCGLHRLLPVEFVRNLQSGYESFKTRVGVARGIGCKFVHQVKKIDSRVESRICYVDVESCREVDERTLV